MPTQRNMPYVIDEPRTPIDYVALLQAWLNFYYMIHRNLPDEAIDTAIEDVWRHIPEDTDLIELDHPGYQGANITIAFNPPDEDMDEDMDEGAEEAYYEDFEEEEDLDADPGYYIIRTYANPADELADNPVENPVAN